MECPLCGGPLVRETRSRLLRYKGLEREVEQPGLWCQECGEGILDHEDAKAAQQALADLRAEAAGVLAPGEVARIRGKLNLSQRAAGELLGGGARAFQRYEAGEVAVSRPMDTLLRLLERHPDLIAEVRAGHQSRNRPHPS